MRIDQEPLSTHSATGHPVSWGPATDAPTFLPPDEITQRPARSSTPRSDSVLTSCPRPATPGTITTPRTAGGQYSMSRAGGAAPMRESVATAARVARASQPELQPQPTATPAPNTAPRAARGSTPPPAAATPPPAAAQPQPQPQLAAPEPQLPPYMQLDGGAASFDPLALPLPPEIAPSIYDWLRRLALQTDLPGADRLLRDALADLTSSLSAMLIYSGPDGLHTLSTTDELPADQGPISAAARARRAIVTPHLAYVPIVTATETIAVIQLVRNPRQEGFSPIEHVIMAAIARESTSIMHHLVLQHLQRRSEAEQDKKGLYRPEALDNHRRRGQEGVIAELSPGWVRRTYYVLVTALVAAAAFAYFVQVPTYSSGTGVVVFDGTPVTSPAPGTVDTIYVQPAQHVREGDLLVSLKADKELADLEQATRELEAAQQQYLIDASDETLRKTLISAQATTKRAADALEQKTVRATADGTVSDIRIRVGGALEFGAPILTIVAPGTEPELWAYLPGSDRPRLRPGQKLQIELAGYQKTRERATIYDVGRNVIGASEAKRSLGTELADALKLAQDGGSYVLVKAKLPRRTFRAKGRTYNYHPGMPAKTEVRVESKRFIVTLLPSLEKYVP